MRKPSPRKTSSIPGQVEKKIGRAADVWKRRCEGASMRTLASEFGLSLATVHNYIEEIRQQLRAETIDLAAQEREQALALIDNAIEKVTPHINGEVEIETSVTVHNHKGEPKVRIITVEEWEARMKACEVLAKLLDRKSKMLGMDAPVKVEAPPPVPPPTPEEQARGREMLKRFCNFAPRPEDFQGATTES